jgi:uncharacterized protein
VRTLIVTVVALVLGYAAICGLMYSQQRSLMYFPQPARGAGELLKFTAADGVEIAATVRNPGQSDALLYFGGNAEDVSVSSERFADLFPSRTIYALHLRGYGASGGEPSEAPLRADALALAQQVLANHPRMQVLGVSLGSGLAVSVAAALPVEKLMLVTPYDSLRAVAQQHYPWLPIRWLLNDTFEAASWAPQVRAPTTILLAGRDRVVPAERGRALAAAFAPGQATVVEFPDANHVSIEQAPGFAAALVK